MCVCNGFGIKYSIRVDCSVSWGCRIHRLLLFRGVRPSPMSVQHIILNKTDDKALVMLEFRGMWSNPSLQSRTGPL